MGIYLAESPKAVFVDDLFEFHTQHVDEDSDIVDMFYDKDALNDEWVYVTFSSGSQKRFSVWGDNNRGITKDFYRFLSDMDKYEWLREEKKKHVEYV